MNWVASLVGVGDVSLLADEPDSTVERSPTTNPHYIPDFFGG